MMLKMTRYFFILSLFLLTGCALDKSQHHVGDPASPRWQRHQEALKKLMAYQANGSFAYLSETKKISARFYWQQKTPSQYRLLLLNPLGNTEWQLDVQNQVVQLVNAKGERHIGNDVEKMLAQLTEMQIPVNQLRLWMLGLPGNVAQYNLNEQDLLHDLKSNYDGQHWTVLLEDYDENIEPPLPTRIQLDQRSNRLKLRIDKWTLP